MSKEQKIEIDKEKANGLFKEFKDFIGDSSVIDMSIGVVVGGALSKIVTSLVNDIFMPLVGILIGGVDFSNLTFQVSDATVYYGSFIGNVVDFLIIAACMFICVKVFLSFKAKMHPDVDRRYKKKTDEKILLLREIRDSLKAEESTDENKTSRKEKQ